MVPSPFLPPSSPPDPPASPPPPSTPPPLEDVVKTEIDCANSAGRRILQSGRPLSVSSVRAYVATSLSGRVSGRDISVVAVPIARGRRLQDERGGTAVSDDPCDFIYKVDIFVRGTVPTEALLGIANSTNFSEGLDDYVAVRGASQDRRACRCVRVLHALCGHFLNAKHEHTDRTSMRSSQMMRLTRKSTH